MTLLPSKYARINCALALLESIEKRGGQWVAVRVDGPMNWSIVEPRSQEAILAACETTDSAERFA